MPPFADRLRLLGKAAVGLFSDPQAQRAQDMLVGILPGARGDPPIRGAQEMLAAYGTIPWLRGIFHKIALATAAVPWQLYATKGRQGAARRAAELASLGMVARQQALTMLQQSGEVKPILSHPFLDLWDKPNGFLPGVATRRLIQLALDISGECFLLKGRNGLSQPTQLWPIPSYWVYATPTPTHPFYRLSWRAWQEDIPETDVLWMKDAHPWNPYGRGVGLAQALADEFETDEYAARFIKAFFYNGARPDLIVSADDLSPADTERMEVEWNQKHKGWWRAFRAHFFSRKVEVQQLTQNFEHLQMKELRTHQRDIAIQAVGIPPEIMAISETSNLAKSLTADTFMAKWVTVPRLELQRSYFQEQLLPEWDERLILDYVSPIPKDIDTQLQAATVAPWSLMVDEWRALQGLEPLKNKAGQVFMVPQNLVEHRFGEEAFGTNPAQAPTPDLAGPPANEDATTAEDTATTAAKGLAGPHVQRDTAPSPQTLEDVAQAYAPAVLALFLQAIEALRSGIDMTVLEQRLASGHAALAREAIPWEAFAVALGGLYVLVAQALEAGARWAATQLTQALQLPTPFPIDTYTSLRAQQRLQTASGHTIYGLVERSQAAVDTILEEGLQAGWPAVRIAQAIRTVAGLTGPQAAQVDRRRQDLLTLGAAEDETAGAVQQLAEDLRQQRATTMAAHESYAAVLLGQQEAWEAALTAGLLNAQTARKRWVTSGGMTVCETICLPMAGVTTTIQGHFALPDGTKVLQPPGHPNCRCVSVLEP
jgi:predicted transcriptional regulator